MIINQAARISSVKTTKKVSKRLLHEHDNIETDSSSTSQEQAHIVNQIDHMLFTLQDINAKTKQDNIIDHAYQMLDLLNQYRADILFDIIEIKKLQQIIDSIQQFKLSANSKAKSIFAQIELMAAVEIAKLAHTVK